MASLQAGRPSFGPNSLRLVEYGLGLIADAKLPHLDNGADEQFRRALEHVLDGLAASLPGSPGDVG